MDSSLLKYTGTAEEFAQETVRGSPATEVHILAAGEPLQLMLVETVTRTPQRMSTDAGERLRMRGRMRAVKAYLANRVRLRVVEHVQDAIR